MRLGNKAYLMKVRELKYLIGLASGSSGLWFFFSWIAKDGNGNTVKKVNICYFCAEICVELLLLLNELLHFRNSPYSYSRMKGYARLKSVQQFSSEKITDRVTFELILLVWIKEAKYTDYCKIINELY